MDPDQWKNNWVIAKENIHSLKIASLTSLAESIETNVKDNDQKFRLLRALSGIFCAMKDHELGICKVGTGFDAWDKNTVTKPVAKEIAGLSVDQQKAMLSGLSNLFCEIEKK